MGYLERNSETWKTPGFSGFECRVSGIGWVRVTKQLGYSPQVSGFWVQRPITTSTLVVLIFTQVCAFVIFQTTFKFCKGQMKNAH